MPRSLAPFMVSALLALPLGCSSSSSGGGGGGGAPTCTANSVQLSGTVNGASESISGTPGSYAFINSLNNQPGTLDVSFNGQGHLHLQWAMLVADDQSIAATGTLVLPDQPTTTYCVNAATMTPKTSGEGGGVSFTLSTLGTGTCPGTTVAGTIEGCAAPSM